MDNETFFADELTRTCIVLSKLREVKEQIVGNEYETYLLHHLTQVEVELKRQLTNLKSPATLNK
jgi:hypothetical protein